MKKNDRLLGLLAAALAGTLMPASAIAGPCKSTGAQASVRAQFQELNRAERQLGCMTASPRTPQHSQCTRIAQERNRLLRAGHVRHCEQSDRRTVSRPARRPAPTRDLVLYCVRPSDGYYFPTPHSQYLERDQTDAALDRCRFICRDPEMRLFTLPGRDIESRELVSLEGGEPYRELANAYAYRESRDFKSCDHQRYHAMVETMRVTKEMSEKLADLRIPLPTPRPQLGAGIEMAEGDAANVSFETTASVAAGTEDPKPVRIVGPQYLAD